MFKFFKTRCYNGGNQHKFKSRFEKTEVEFVKKLISVECISRCPQDQNPFLMDKYVCDICVWCGKIIKKE